MLHNATNTWLLLICLLLFVVFLIVGRDERRRQHRRHVQGHLKGLLSEDERRKYPRHVCELDITYRVLDRDDEAVLSVSRNISRGGICLAVPEKLLNGTLLLLHISIQGKLQEVKGEIAWCKEISTPSSQKRAFEVGVRFLDLSEKNWTKVKTMITDKSKTKNVALWVALFYFAGLVIPASALALNPFGSKKRQNRYFYKAEEDAQSEEQRREAVENEVVRDMHESARVREEREKALQEAQWLERGESHYAAKEFNDAYRYYQMLMEPTVARPLREKAKDRITELEENDILKDLIKEEKTIKALANIDDPDQVIRLNAIRELGTLKALNASTALVDSLQDNDPFVRRISAWALGQMDDASGIAPLINALSDNEELVRDQVHTSLVTLTKQDFGMEAEAWVTWWREAA